MYAVRIENFAPRAHKRTAGLLVLRLGRAADRDRVVALRGALADAGVIETDEGVEAEDQPAVDGGQAPIEILAARWRPPKPERADAHLAALEAVGARFDVDTIWCVLGVARARQPAIWDPGKKRRKPKTKWKAVVPVWKPGDGALPFPVDGYPDIVDELDWYDYGLAVKLAGPQLAGEEQVLEAFCDLWCQSFEEFRHVGTEYDAIRRAAVLWVDRWSFPRSGKSLVRHTMWLAARIHDVMPIVHASFQGAEMAWKYRGLTGDSSEPFILGGNPLLGIYREHGEPGVMSWVDDPPAAWSRGEVAAMLVALVEGHSPQDSSTTAAAVRLADRAIALDPDQDSARADILTLLVHSGQIDEALERVRGWQRPDLSSFLVDAIEKHAPQHLADVMRRLPVRPGNVAAMARYGLGPETLVGDLWAHLANVAVAVPDDGPDSDAVLTGLMRDLETTAATQVVVAVARGAPDRLADFLRLLPVEPDTVEYLYPASYEMLRTPNSSDPHDATMESLLICERIVDLPATIDHGNREWYTWSHASAIIFAYHLGLLERATDLVERSLHLGDENPAIYYNAACVYGGGLRDADRALDLARRAVLAGYRDPDAIRTDDDLTLLHHRPEFQAIFATPTAIGGASD
jgi:hypothetical protein